MSAIASYALYTGVGKENKTVQNIKKVARRCKEILSASFLAPGYVRVEVVASDNADIKSVTFDMPKGTKMLIKMVPGVIEVVGNGKEAVSLED